MDTGKEATNEALRDVMSELLEQARKSPEMPKNEHHQVITVHHQEPPKPPPTHVWLCVAGAWVASLAALWSLQSAWNSNQRMADLRIDMQAERLSREQMDNWAAQEVTAIRSYITNGRLVPMQPRPDPQKDRKNVP